MKTRILKTIASTLSTVLILGAFMTATAGVNDRQKHQQKRIRQGIRSGELTRVEVKKLEKEQARIQRHESKAKSDGEFTLKERAKIQKEQNKASRKIFKEKHDKQDRN